MKKSLMILVTLALVFSFVLSSCASAQPTATTVPPTSAPSEPTATNAPAEPPAEVVMAYPILGNSPQDLQKVQDALNALPQVKNINVTIKLMPIPIFQYGDQMNLILSGSEQVDLMISFSPIQNTTTLIQNGQLNDITDLLNQYAQGTLSAVGEDYLKAVRVNGKYYGVPTIHDLATAVAVTMRTDLVKKYNIDVTKIKTFDDLTAVFQTIKAGEPDIAPFFPGGASLNPLDAYILATSDKLGDGNGNLLNYGSDLTVSNYFASADYAKMVGLLHSWYKQGYILTDAATVTDGPYDEVKAGKVFAIFTTYKPGQQAQDSRSTGMDMTTIQIGPAFSQTSLVSGIQWVVPINSKNPKKAVQLLNLFYTDAEVLNMFNYGIKDVHYILKDNNQVSLPTGVTPANSPYYLSIQWESGNEFITYTWDTDSADLWQQTKQYNTDALKSKAFGFTFDPSNVQTEIAAVQSVYQQYRVGLENGVSDPATVIPEFLAKLKAAGLDTIIAEKQKQLDAWVAANK